MAERRQAWRCTVPDGLEKAMVSIGGRQFEGELIDQSAIGCRLMLSTSVKVRQGDVLLLYIHSGWHEGIVKRIEEKDDVMSLGVEWGRDLYYDSRNATIFQLAKTRLAQMIGDGKSRSFPTGLVLLAALIPFLILGYYNFVGGEAGTAGERIEISEVSDETFDLEQRVAKAEVENRLRMAIDVVQLLLRDDSREAMELDDDQAEQIEQILTATKTKLAALYDVLRPSTLPIWSDASLRERNRLLKNVEVVLRSDQLDRWRAIARAGMLPGT